MAQKNLDVIMLNLPVKNTATSGITSAQTSEIPKETPAPDREERQPTTGAHDFDLAAISISSRVPEFWPHMPRLWFAQFENALSSQRPSEEMKFSLAVSKLTPDAVQQISDIILNENLPRRYQALKDRLLQVYEDSINAQFKKLVSELELGTQKPSQLLRKMVDMGRNMQVSEQMLKNLWLSRLPANIRASLAVSQEQNLENLAKIADSVMENLNVGELAALQFSNTSTANFPVSEIMSQMNKLTLEVASLRAEVQTHRQNNYRSRGRGRFYRRNRSRSRSRSTPRITPQDPKWLCRYHYKFKSQARKCEQPCNWNKTQGN